MPRNERSSFRSPDKPNQSSGSDNPAQQSHGSDFEERAAYYNQHLKLVVPESTIQNVALSQGGYGNLGDQSTASQGSDPFHVSHGYGQSSFGGSDLAGSSTQQGYDQPQFPHGYGQSSFGGSDLAGSSTQQGYDQPQFPHGYGQPPFGGSDLAGSSTQQGYDQPQFPHGYGQPPFGGSDLAGPPMQQGYDQPQFPHGYGQSSFGGSDLAGPPMQQGYDQSHTDDIGIHDIAEAYMVAGSHKQLPEIYRKAIARQPFTQQDLDKLNSDFRAAEKDGRISSKQKENLRKIVQRQSSAGKAASQEYAKSDERKETNREYEKRTKRKADRREYAKSDAGKAVRQKHMQKKTDSQVLNIPGVDMLGEENFR